MAEDTGMTVERGMQIEILFKEYETLREEIQNRMNNRFICAGFLGAIAAFVGGQGDLESWLRWAVALTALVLVLVLWWALGLLIYKAHLRIAGIERMVNDLAGATLLEWESNVQNRPFGRSSLLFR